MTAAPARHDIVNDTMLAEVLAGLRAYPKTLPPKLFYDSRGAELFETICELPEYYLTRSELSILEKRVGEIASFVGPRAALIEYGSGAGQKIRLLLDALEHPVAYVPVDISNEQLDDVAASLAEEYPDVEIKPLCADYTKAFGAPDLPAHVARRVAFFPGSTIGNFDPPQAAMFLSRVRELVGQSGALILGVDRVKDTAVLDAAYNDSEGVTAQFNLNILHRIRCELGVELNVNSFEHLAFFNEAASRIEMHLRSRIAQTITVAGEPIEFAKGETIWTESSYKYSEELLHSLLEASGFKIDRLWTDLHENFWVSILSSR